MSQVLALFEPGEVAPYSQPAEEVLLGSIFINPKAYLDVASFLTSEDFFILRNGYIFEAMEYLQAHDEPVEFLTVIERLKAQERLDDIGGSAYLSYLSSNAGTSVHAEAYGRIIQRLAKRRRLLELAGELTHLARDEDNDIHDIYSTAAKLLRDIFDDIQNTELSLDQIAQQAEDHIFGADEQPGVSFMIQELDDICGAMIAGDTVLVAARTGVGKTRYCTQLALAEAQKGHRVLFMTTEEAEYQTHWRLIEMLSKGELTVKEMRSGQIRKDDKKAALYLVMAERIKKMPIEIVRVNGWDVGRVAARISKHPAGTYRVVLVDYLQRLGQTPGWDRKRGDEELGHRMQVLKDTALNQETVMVVPSQINRDGAGKDQGPEHLAGSDKIGHEADIMLSIQRDESDGPNATFRIGKTRWGEGLGRKVTVYFDPHAGTYHNAAKEYQEKATPPAPQPAPTA